MKMCDFGISGYLVDSVAKTMDAGCKPYMAVSASLCSLSPDCKRLLLKNQPVPPHPEIKATQECSGVPDSAEPPFEPSSVLIPQRLSLCPFHLQKDPKLAGAACGTAPCWIESAEAFLGRIV